MTVNNRPSPKPAASLADTMTTKIDTSFAKLDGFNGEVDKASEWKVAGIGVSKNLFPGVQKGVSAVANVVSKVPLVGGLLGGLLGGGSKKLLDHTDYKAIQQAQQARLRMIQNMRDLIDNIGKAIQKDPAPNDQ